MHTWRRRRRVGLERRFGAAAETQRVSLTRLPKSPPAAAWSCGSSKPSDAIVEVLDGAVVHAATARATVAALGCEQVQEVQEEDEEAIRSQMVRSSRRWS